MTQAAPIWIDEMQTLTHVSVMPNEISQAIAPRPGGVYVDATLGAGGHTEALLMRCPDIRVVAFDRDEQAIAVACERLAPFLDRVTIRHAPFDTIPEHLGSLGLGEIDGLIADLGLSSLQLDEADRGMSFRAPGPIDMRMDRGSGETALELLARITQDELADLIYEYGEERASRRIARCITQALERNELSTTLDLRRAVVRAIGPRRVGGIDPATRTFQALRIAVNGELDQLDRLLGFASSVVAPAGTIAILSFHSLEDRRVKRALLDGSVWQRLWKKPMLAGAEEQRNNPRARSAKLRAARRLAEGVVLAPEEMLDMETPTPPKVGP